jgi:hypothetical protein
MQHRAPIVPECGLIARRKALKAGSVRMPCRQWLLYIAEDYAASVGLAEREARASARAAAADAALLLRLMPWHAAMVVGGAEVAGSFCCIWRRLFHPGNPDPRREIGLFAKMPVVATPLLRLYRSAVAASWFEQSEALAAFGLEALPARRERFRRLRSDIA